MVLSRDGSLRVAWFTGAEGRTGVYFRQILFETIDSTSTPVTVMASEELPTVHVDALWQRRAQSGVGHQWLRQAVVRASRQVFEA